MRLLTKSGTKRYEGHVSALVTDTRHVPRATGRGARRVLLRSAQDYPHSLLHHLLLMKREGERERRIDD